MASRRHARYCSAKCRMAASREHSKSDRPPDQVRLKLSWHQAQTLRAMVRQTTMQSWAEDNTWQGRWREEDLHELVTAIDAAMEY